MVKKASVAHPRKLTPAQVYYSTFPLHCSIMRVAHRWAQDRSKDPRTKVGACVYDPETGAMHLGYNGFNPGFPDLKQIWDNRTVGDPNSKYTHVVHAEANAVRKALQAMGSDVKRCYLYCTHFPCRACMKDWVLPTGIKIVYYGSSEHHDDVSLHMAKSARVELIEYPVPE